MERGRRQRHLKHDGTVTEVDLTSHVTSFAGREVRCAVIDDVTEREHLQRRLRQSRAAGEPRPARRRDRPRLQQPARHHQRVRQHVRRRRRADRRRRPRLARVCTTTSLEIVAAGDRAAGLTRQLLAFARADAVAEPRVLDLNSVVADVEKLLRRTLGEDITLVTHLTDEPCPVKADVGRLEQVLVNLAVNARDAMPNGGTLTIDTDAVTVDEHYAAQHPGLQAGRYMRLRVSDTGTGMSKATLERAFEPFFTTKPKGQGTGLGLATIYGIITQAGGHAQIYSEPGHGTTVTALLPVTDEHRRDRAEQPAAAPRPRRRPDDPARRGRRQPARRSPNASCTATRLHRAVRRHRRRGPQLAAADARHRPAAHRRGHARHARARPRRRAAGATARRCG